MNIAFIPIRKGSKGIPHKNIKPLADKPLVYWVAKASEGSALIDKIVIATDCDITEKLVNSFKFNKLEVYRRSEQNAQDNSPTESVISEYLETRDYNSDDLLIVIQATSPLTTSKNLDDVIKIYYKYKAASVLTCIRSKRFFWNENGTPANYDYRCRPRRQNFQGSLMENGACYLTSIGAFKDSNCLLNPPIAICEMPDYTAYELDEPIDWIILEAIIKKYHLLKSE